MTDAVKELIEAAEALNLWELTHYLGGKQDFNYRLECAISAVKREQLNDPALWDRIASVSTQNIPEGNRGSAENKREPTFAEIHSIPPIAQTHPDYEEGN